MFIAVVANFISLFVIVFNLLILTRVLLSWFMPRPTNRPAELIFELTEPVLSPIRRVIPPSGLIDWSPLVAFILLQLLAMLADRLVTG